MSGYRFCNEYQKKILVALDKGNESDTRYYTDEVSKDALGKKLTGPDCIEVLLKKEKKMLLSDKNLGLIILVLWGLSGTIFLTAPGSVRFQKPHGGLLVWVYNFIHLIYEMFLVPFTGLLLFIENLTFFKATQFFPVTQSLLTLKLTGLLLLITGVTLFCWARIILKRSFRLACVAPHREDVLITEGPYRFVRNPMYTSVLVNCIGFSLLVQSYVFALLFLFFLIVLVFNIIPTEEKYLETAYGHQYFVYKKQTKRLFPVIY